jgi:hypothetical protein
VSENSEERWTFKMPFNFLFPFLLFRYFLNERGKRGRLFEQSELPSLPNECGKMPYKKATGASFFHPFFRRVKNGAFPLDSSENQI